MCNKWLCSAHGLTCALGEKSSPLQKEPRIYEEFDFCGFLRKEFVSSVQEFQCCHSGLDLTQGRKWRTALQKNQNIGVFFLCGQQNLGYLGIFGKLLPWLVVFFFFNQDLALKVHPLFVGHGIAFN